LPGAPLGAALAEGWGLLIGFIVLGLKNLVGLPLGCIDILEDALGKTLELGTKELVGAALGAALDEGFEMLLGSELDDSKLEVAETLGDKEGYRKGVGNIAFLPFLS